MNIFMANTLVSTFLILVVILVFFYHGAIYILKL